MVSFEEYVDSKVQYPTLRELLKIVRAYPDPRLTATKIGELIKSNYGKKISQSALYRDLSKLVTKGYLVKEHLPSNGELGRNPMVYRISDSFLDAYRTHEEVAGYQTGCRIRCNDPMKCPDRSCTICRDAGIKTCWDS